MAHLSEKWLPQTQIVFADTGIDDTCKPYFTSNAALIAWIKTKVEPGTTTITDYSFQRDMAGMPIRVDHDDAQYQALLQCDTVAWINPQQIYQPRWMVAHITGVEWKNPNCSFVYYEIDWYTSFVDCINWPASVCMIEREHVKKDWDGSNPLLYQCGVDEGIRLEHRRILDADNWNPYTGGYKYRIISPYSENVLKDPGGEVTPTYKDTSSMKRYVGLQAVDCGTKEEVNKVLNTAAINPRVNIENIVSILTVPNGELVQQSKNFIPPWVKTTGYNNAKCWSGEFNTFRMWVPMADRPISFTPEFIGPSYANFTVQVLASLTIDTCCIQYVPKSQREPAPFTDVDMSAFITEYPRGAWTADAYAQWLSLNAVPLIAGLALNTVGTVTSLYTAQSGAVARFNYAGAQGNDLGRQLSVDKMRQNNIDAGLSLGNDLLGAYQTWVNARQNGASASGIGNLGVDQTFEKYGYICYMFYYQADTYDMIAVDQFFDRFGYKVNALRAPDPTNRPKWYYLKTVDAHVTDKGGLVSMGSIARRAIEALFNTGVTIFRTDLGIDVGDFSDPTANKAT